MMIFTLENPPVTSLDSEHLRTAMRAWSAGVTVVTAAHDGERHGMTVNSFTSISLEPALITISLQRATRTYELVTRAGVFGLTILASNQREISELFAGRGANGRDRFAGLRLETLVTGAPLIVGGLAWLDCRVVQTYDAGRNALFIAEVLAARGTNKGDPLLYHDRKYWQLKHTSIPGSPGGT